MLKDNRCINQFQYLYFQPKAMDAAMDVAMDVAMDTAGEIVTGETTINEINSSGNANIQT